MKRSRGLLNSMPKEEIALAAAKGALKMTAPLFLNSKIRDAERASVRAHKDLDRATLKVKLADARLEKLKASRPAVVKKAS